MCAHGSMARMAGERLQTPTALLVRCGWMARATRAWSRFSGGRRGRRDCSVVMWRSHVKVRGDMFLSFGIQVQQLL